MPETSLRNDEQIRRNIELAYIGLTFKGELVDAASLTKEVISIGRMAADNSLAVLVQKSARLVGTIKDIKFEESSQRYLVTFRANNQKSKLHQILVVPPEGRDAPAKPSERGEASPHAPTSSPEPAAALRSDPSKGRLHCELTLSLRSVRTLPIGRLHCTSLTVCAESRGGFSPQFCSANEPPSGIRASFP